jgi:PAS domain S-box-containing protein
MWVTTGPCIEKKAKNALRDAIPDFDLYLRKEQIRIVPDSEWYLKDNIFNVQRILNAWTDQLNQALSSGFAGMRVTSNMSGFGKKGWRKVADYEKEVNNVIDKYRMLAICSYCIDECVTPEIIEVVSWHQSAIIRREGKWEVIEGGDRKKIVEALRVSESKYRTLLEGLPEKIFLKDTNSVYMSCSENYAKDFKIKAEEIVGKTDNDLYPRQLAEKYKADDRRIIKSGKTEDINEKCIQNGREIIVHAVKSPVRDKEGNITGILGILLDITAQRQAQKKLLDYQKRLQDLASKMSLTEECERRRIAVELHDHVMQDLILFKISSGELRGRNLPEELVKPLDEIYKHLDRIIDEMRSLTFDLGSSVLYELGLEAAIREWLFDEVQQKYGIHTEFEDDEHPKPLDDDVRAVLYRAVRELLVNIVKHAQAHKVKVSIGRENYHVRIVVADDGIGFVPSPQLNKTGSIGLFSIRERLSYLGGNIEIESKPGQGTHITLIAPINRENIENDKDQRGHYEHKNYSGG